MGQRAFCWVNRSTGAGAGSVWRWISARLVTTDKDRSKGIYFVAPVSKGGKDKHPDYQVVVRETNGSCEVTVVDQSGKSDAETARLVEMVYQNLDKNDRGDAVRPSR